MSCISSNFSSFFLNSLNDPSEFSKYLSNGELRSSNAAAEESNGYCQTGQQQQPEQYVLHSELTPEEMFRGERVQQPQHLILNSNQQQHYHLVHEPQCPAQSTKWPSTILTITSSNSAPQQHQNSCCPYHLTAISPNVNLPGTTSIVVANRGYSNVCPIHGVQKSDHQQLLNGGDLAGNSNGIGGGGGSGGGGDGNSTSTNSGGHFMDLDGSSVDDGGGLSTSVIPHTKLNARASYRKTGMVNNVDGNIVTRVTIISSNNNYINSNNNNNNTNNNNHTTTTTNKSNSSNGINNNNTNNGIMTTGGHTNGGHHNTAATIIKSATAGVIPMCYDEVYPDNGSGRHNGNNHPNGSTIIYDYPHHSNNNSISGLNSKNSNESTTPMTIELPLPIVVTVAATAPVSSSSLSSLTVTNLGNYTHSINTQSKSNTSSTTSDGATNMMTTSNGLLINGRLSHPGDVSMLNINNTAKGVISLGVGVIPHPTSSSSPSSSSPSSSSSCSSGSSQSISNGKTSTTILTTVNDYPTLAATSIINNVNHQRQTSMHSSVGHVTINNVPTVTHTPTPPPQPAPLHQQHHHPHNHPHHHSQSTILPVLGGSLIVSGISPVASGSNNSMVTSVSGGGSSSNALKPLAHFIIMENFEVHPSHKIEEGIFQHMNKLPTKKKDNLRQLGVRFTGQMTLNDKSIIVDNFIRFCRVSDITIMYNIDHNPLHFQDIPVYFE